MTESTIPGSVAKFIEYAWGETSKTQNKDSTKLDLESKLASPQTLLGIIQEIEDNFLQGDHADNKKIVERIGLLFSTIEQYKFLFPFAASRLYEVCVFKKLLLRVYEDELLNGHNTFSFHRLITIVLNEKKKELGEKFCDHIETLLQRLVKDLEITTGNDKIIFQNSLNIGYLRFVASETGKKCLKEIEELFQDKIPTQAMASIQTNHFLYIYLEMLQKIWSFVVGVEPVCTWPAFDSTMQMHQDIIVNLYDWVEKCEKFITQEEFKATSTDAGKDIKPTLQISRDKSKLIKSQISLILIHMAHYKCLKYAGDAINQIQILVMQLWNGPHKDTEMYGTSIMDVFMTYCKVKCKDNKDKIPDFKYMEDVGATENNVKTATQALLRPSAYQNSADIHIPQSYITCMDKLFTVETGGNVVLSKDTTCQQIINLTLANFGITIRQTVSLADSGERRKCVKASLGIITKSSDDVYLNYYQNIPFNREKVMGSWDITVDTEDTLSQSDDSLEYGLDSKNYFNMFFDDDVLTITQKQKMYLLLKFISNSFFEFGQPVNTDDGMEHLFEFQEKVFMARMMTNIAILKVESTKISENTVIQLYQKLYGDYDACERVIMARMAGKNAFIKSDKGTELETKKDESRWSLNIGTILTKIQTKFIHFMRQGKQEGSQMPDDLTEDNNGIEVSLQEARALNNKSKALAQKAALEKNPTEKGKLEAQCLDIQGKVSKICTDLIPILESKCNTQLNSIQQLAITQTQNQMNEDAKNEYDQKLNESIDQLETIRKQLCDAKDLQHNYGPWPQYDKPVGQSLHNTLMPNSTPTMPSANNTAMSFQSFLPQGFKHDDTASGQPREQMLSGGGTNSMSERPTGRTSQTSDASLASAAPPVVSPSPVSDPSFPSAFLGTESPAATGARNMSAAPRMVSSVPVIDPSVAPAFLSSESPAATGARNTSANTQPEIVKTEVDLRDEIPIGLMGAHGTASASSEATEADAPRQLASNGMLEIAPIDDMEASVENFSTKQTYTTADLNTIVQYPELKDILLPQGIEAFQGKQATKILGGKVRLNIVAYKKIYSLNNQKYEILPAHAFVLVNSTHQIRAVARSLLTNFAKTGSSTVNNKIQFCKSDTFQNCFMPEWITDAYLNDVLPLLPMPTQVWKDGSNMTDVSYVLDLKGSGVFDKGDLKDDPTNILKARYLLYIALTELGIKEKEESRKIFIESQKSNDAPTSNTPRQGSGAQGLFTQPTAWCDESADEDPPESARVCCRCGMCPSVVQNAEKTGLLAYGTAPPTHPLLDTCSRHPLLNACLTHSGYSVPRRFVFAPAATPGMVLGMVPGTPAQQVYMLVQNTRS